MDNRTGLAKGSFSNYPTDLRNSLTTLIISSIIQTSYLINTRRITMTKFNGHKNYNHWNVSLWVNNDERLYNMAMECIKEAPNTSWCNYGRGNGYKPRDAAAFLMMEKISAEGIHFTPDGAPYSATTVRAAMVGM